VKPLAPAANPGRGFGHSPSENPTGETPWKLRSLSSSLSSPASANFVSQITPHSFDKPLTDCTLHDLFWTVFWSGVLMQYLLYCLRKGRRSKKKLKPDEFARRLGDWKQEQEMEPPENWERREDWEAWMRTRKTAAY
jgi:hypothetical protein